MTRKSNLAGNNISVGFFILSPIIFFIIGYCLFPENREGIKFFASLLGWGAAVFGAYCAVVSLNLKIKQDKRAESFKILERLNMQEWVGVRTLVGRKSEGRHKISDQKFYALVNGHKQFYDGVMMLLGLLEDTSIAIQEDYVDEIVLYKSLADIVPAGWKNLRGYIEQYRKKSNDSTFWIEFEKLHNAWEMGRKLSDNKVLPDLLAP
ncbi:MAG: DUF4760 domain-containing protein [bacterium]